MSRKGTCLDNSLMENFFGIMKQDRSFEELEKEVINYIHYYNNDRVAHCYYFVYRFHIFLLSLN